jgi:16S rRNA (uracil1498-N3)-methyltransferase
LHRIHVPGSWAPGNVLTLDGKDARRILRVLRLKPGHQFVLFDGKGREGTGEVIREDRDRVEVLVRDVGDVGRESPLRIHLIQGLPKSDRMEWIIQKATELGVAEVGVLMAHRCVPRWNPRAGKGRLMRWQRILVEAARQSGRSEVPILSGPWSLGEMCEGVAEQAGLKLVLWEGEASLGLGDALRVADPIPREVWVAVGPEGGFEDWEVAQMVEASFLSVHVGPRILRTETAGPAAVAILQYVFGDLG